MIYLASPYSHEDPDVERARYEATLRFAATQMREGIVLFSPIVYGRPFQRKYNFGGDHNTWLQFNKKMLDMAEEMWVLRLPGWNKSKGVAYEIDYFGVLRRSIEYKDPI